ncbi:hypothetical protein OOT55_14915 [Marinimicrobium sp. C6131]|uniref:hypothetical protein n=1 Tax=Marinimicrobium sp. C6131 TaxID=3022676 RepID=UPI00223CC68F|nr:hypothetical protein [Marinimicrobium sp. C6131]UZJ43936.1 hypothetical protein OOT55_14915 [Marinimicrobium sp. C6131]
MRLLSVISILLLSLAANAENPTYPLHYHVTLNPEHDRAEVVIESDHHGLLKLLDFDIGSGRYSNLEANGELQLEDGRAIWTPPKRNARLSLHVDVSHERDPGEYDSLMTEDWAIFRGDDIIPAARVRSTVGAQAEAWLHFTLPDHWTSVSTGWKKAGARRFRIDNPERRFDRPTGWMIAGQLGTRREKLGDTELVVSAPKGSNLRRMDVVTLITNVWPEVEKAFQTAPPKFAVIGHGDPMWRGALSGPNALFLHGDRPMVSENGTSTVIHELIHVVTRIDSRNQSDWLVEGLAEFYAVELLYRAGSLTEARRTRVMKGLADWGSDIKTLRKKYSAGATSARAVVLLDELDREIQSATDGERNLDDVARVLIEKRTVTTEMFVEVVEEVMGKPSKVLDTPLLRKPSNTPQPKAQ